MAIKFPFRIIPEGRPDAPEQLIPADALQATYEQVGTRITNVIKANGIEEAPSPKLKLAPNTLTEERKSHIASLGEPLRRSAFSADVGATVSGLTKEKQTPAIPTPGAHR